MAKMRAVDAAAAVLRKEGVTTVFGVPGAAINPLYSAMKKNGGFEHVLGRHVEGASHMAEGYTRVLQQAFPLMRSGRPGPVLIDQPFDVQMAEIEFDIETYEPLPVYKPAATRAQAEKAMQMLNAAARPLIVAGG